MTSIGESPQIRPPRLRAEINSDLHRGADFPQDPKGQLARPSLLDLGDSLLGDARDRADINLSQPTSAPFGTDAGAEPEVIHGPMMGGRDQPPI
ncbi:MAG: hypothetical protein ABSB34_05555 [Candidatus Limnocylindrales bacterium]